MLNRDERDLTQTRAAHNQAIQSAMSLPFNSDPELYSAADIRLFRAFSILSTYAAAILDELRYANER